MQEIKDNLFESKECLAHCVSRDLKMGAGIAIEFKKRFEIPKPADVGSVTYVKDDSRYIFYLVTKERYFDKPTYETFTSSIKSLKKLCDEYHIKKLSIPRLGCGLDKLAWERVKKILLENLQDIELTVFYI